jgi:hypothetical protein
MRPLPLTDLLITLASIGGLGYVVARLGMTVIPLQVKEAKVVNGLAKLRKHLLLSGVAVIVAAFIAFAILSVAIFIPRQRIVTEILLLCFVGAFIIIAETLHAIYNAQYTPEHKALSEKIVELERQRSQDQHPDAMPPNDA